MNAALILTLLVGVGLDLPRWDAGALTPDSEAVAEVLVQGTGSLDVMSSCDCLRAEVAGRWLCLTCALHDALSQPATPAAR